MKNELNKHKSSDKIKWWLTLIAFLLVGATIAGMLLGYLKPRTINKEPSEQEQEANLDIGGLKVNQSVDNGMSLMSVKLMSREYETYGVTNSAESAFILNATISPDTAANQGVSWDSFWLGQNSTFSQDKAVSDYVTITPQANGTSLLIECIAPFADGIVIQATSQDNPSCTAFCELDYAQKVLGATLNIGNIPVVLDGITEVQYEVSPYATGMGGVITASIETSDVYTIAQDFTQTVTFTQDTDTEAWFRVKDSYPTGIQLLYRDGFSATSNWIGETYYFDYTNDICNWLIFQRTGDINFGNLTTAEVIDYFSNITAPTLAIMTFTIEGEYDSYSYTSRINCAGFTNNTPVNNLTLDKAGYVF